MLTVGVTTDMQMMIDPSAQVMLQPQQSGAVGNDRDNTYFRKDWYPSYDTYSPYREPIKLFPVTIVVF